MTLIFEHFPYPQIQPVHVCWSKSVSGSSFTVTCLLPSTAKLAFNGGINNNNTASLDLPHGSRLPFLSLHVQSMYVYMCICFASFIISWILLLKHWNFSVCFYLHRLFIFLQNFLHPVLLIFLFFRYLLSIPSVLLRSMFYSWVDLSSTRLLSLSVASFVVPTAERPPRCNVVVLPVRLLARLLARLLFGRSSTRLLARLIQLQWVTTTRPLHSLGSSCWRE